MGYRKYVSDWQIQEEVDTRGRVVRTPIYRGPLFRYALTKEERRPFVIALTCLGVLQWILYVTSMLFDLNTMGQFYIMVPYGVRLLPLCFMTMSLYSFLVAKEPLKREQSDGLYPRMTTCLAIMMAFGGVAFVAAVVASLLFRQLTGADIYLLVAMGVQLGIDGVLY